MRLVGWWLGLSSGLPQFTVNCLNRNIRLNKHDPILVEILEDARKEVTKRMNDR